MPARLFFLHDGRTDLGALIAALRSSFDVVRVDLDDDDGLAGLSSAAAVLDVDLSDPATIRRLQKNLPRRGEHPRLMAVEQTARSERIQAGVMGATGLIFRPLVVAETVERIERALRMESLERELGRGEVARGAPGRSSILAAEDALGALFTSCLGDAGWDGRVLEEAGSQITETVRDIGHEAWMSTVRRHHDGTYQHCMLVTGMAVGFGTALGMSTRDVERLAKAGLAHDAGKARVPVSILDKPGKLTEEEFSIIKCHPEWGWEFLRRSDPHMDRDVLDVVLHHHEALDGSGYPHRLEGRAISDMTRVLTVCDIYGALSERRSYKPPMPKAKIMRFLQEMAESGKVETALVRALDRVVSDEGSGKVLTGYAAKRRA